MKISYMLLLLSLTLSACYGTGKIVLKDKDGNTTIIKGEALPRATPLEKIPQGE